MKLKRNELRELIAFYTSHGKFRRHLQNKRLAEDLKCKFCETAEHVMCKCEAYAIIRHKYFGKPEYDLLDFSNLEFESLMKCCKELIFRMWTPANR